MPSAMLSQHKSAVQGESGWLLASQLELRRIFR
jgi:hypothetical protein